MTEKMPQKPDSRESLDKALEAASEQLKSLEKKNKLSTIEVKEAKEKQSAEKHKAKQELEKQLDKQEKMPPKKSTENKPEPINKGMKKQQYAATMRRVEAKLPRVQRAFSKVIHNPTVDAVSNVTGKTVARPSGLLGGSLFAFVGLTLVYYNAIKLGFTYNPGSAFIFFASLGWLSGILIEYIYKALKQLLKS